MQDKIGVLDKEVNKPYFSHPGVVESYAAASQRVGLWESERKVFTRLFKEDDVLLELGTGAGRIAFGLWELGYRQIMAVDSSKPMIEAARRQNLLADYGVFFHVADATRLKFEDNGFDGAIFGFNGLMQIPGRANRQRAMHEIHRVVRPGGWFVFTAHGRDNAKHRKYWRDEEEAWRQGKQDPRLAEFGDICYPTPQGPMFIHCPARDDLLADLTEVGWRHEADTPRSLLANESGIVRDFSDECDFWVVQKPG